ncbi:MAG: hypothetical protein JNM80_14275 [Phycisphaerae bacterium]|nr:hypothetical protein [Phycisphaerae bacterium]
MTTASRQPRLVTGDAIAIRWSVAFEGGATIEVRGGQVLRAVLVAAGGAKRELARADAVWTRDGDLVHLDAPGVVHATLRDECDGLRVLYARCPAIHAAGGTCELLGAAWERPR